MRAFLTRWLRPRIAPTRPPSTSATPQVTTPAAPDPAPGEAAPAIPIGLADIHLSGWLQNATGELLRGFPIRADDTVLDIGCGDGGYATFCARQGASIILADVDAAKLAHARARLEAQRQTAAGGARAIEVLVTDADPLPLADATVSKVVAMEVLEHVADPARFLRELVRVAQPGAQFLLSVPHAYNEALQQKIAPPVYFQAPNHIRIFAQGELAHLVHDAGLVVESTQVYGFYHTLWWSFIWAADQPQLAPPWHPLLDQWAHTWATLLALPDGPRIKAALDQALPKSQVVIARKI